jgi:hypothetical protein
MPQVGESRNAGRVGKDGVSWLDRAYWNGKEDKSLKATNWNVIDDAMYPTTRLVRTALDALGAPGSNVVLAMTAGETLGGQRVVRTSGATAMYANSSTQAHAQAVIGITTGAATSGAAVTVQSEGQMTDPSFSFTAGLPVYLNGNGTMSNTPPSSGFILQVAVAISATTIAINIKQPISI